MKLLPTKRMVSVAAAPCDAHVIANIASATRCRRPGAILFRDDGRFALDYTWWLIRPRGTLAINLRKSLPLV